MQEDLLCVFNKIRQEESIPNEWKEGEIISIYKGKGDREVMKNMRGITLCSNIEKILERVINNRIVPIIEYSEAQAGGRKQFSTTDQLFILKAIINQAINDKQKL